MFREQCTNYLDLYPFPHLHVYQDIHVEVNKLARFPLFSYPHLSVSIRTDRNTYQKQITDYRTALGFWLKSLNW